MASTSRDIPTQGPHGTQGLGHATTNVGTGERWLSATSGGALLVYGLLRRDRSGLATAVAGGALIVRGLTGRSLLYRLVGFNKAAGSYPSVQKSKTINRSAEELFRYWRNFENLPRFMDHLQSVRTTAHKTSHWVAKAPLSSSVEWDAEIVDEQPNELIAWRSLPGAAVYNAGSVRFEQLPENRGTEVHVTFEYDPPAGFIGALVTKLFGEEPNQQVEGDLRRFKNIMEAREIPTTAGQSSARDEPDPSALPIEQRVGANKRQDMVQRASEESFPASDAPAWTGVDNGASQELGS